jgi:hypothetical protein
VITTLEMPIANTIIAIPTNNTVQPKYSWIKYFVTCASNHRKKLCKKLIQNIHTPIYIKN